MYTSKIFYKSENISIVRASNRESSCINHDEKNLYVYKILNESMVTRNSIRKASQRFMKYRRFLMFSYTYFNVIHDYNKKNRFEFWCELKFMFLFLCRLHMCVFRANFESNSLQPSNRL